LIWWLKENVFHKGKILVLKWFWNWEKKKI